MSETPEHRREKTTRTWKALGAFANNRVGAHLYQAAGPLVNQVIGRAQTPRLSDVPFTRFNKTLRDCRVALVSTAGYHRAEDRPFDADALAGDSSFREIPMKADPRALTITHAHYPHRYAQADPNVLLPLDRLRELADEGVFQLGSRCFSFGFAGTITGALVNEPEGSAHEVARRLREDGVDILLVVPA